MVPSYNVRETVRFFENVFDFTILRDDENYVILIKDCLTLHIQRAGVDIGEMSFYLGVDNIDKWWGTAEEKLKGLKVKPPFDREYGMREVHIIIPDTKTLVFVGQAIGWNYL